MPIKVARAGDKDLDLRQLSNEKGQWIMDCPSMGPAHWVLWSDEKGHLLAAARVARAEESGFAALGKLSPKRLEQSIALDAVWTSHSPEASEALPGLLYAALRLGRIWRRTCAVSYVPHSDTPVARLARMQPLARASKVSVNGAELAPVAQTLEMALHWSAAQCSSPTWAVVQPTLVDEVTDFVEEWIQRFLAGSWATSIRERRISREQYLSCLKNMHQYVRQTTRHLGRAVAHSEDRHLRNHYIEHLKGEINHELHIERDLRHLGADPEYVVVHSVPSTATKEFMAIQETTIGFYQDAVLLMACPIAAEGITAHIQQDFVKALRDTIASWGVDTPESATTFLSSHVHYDSGDDGHFAMTVEVLRKYLTNEGIQRKFMSTLAAATDCIERSFNSNIDEYNLFSTVL